MSASIDWRIASARPIALSAARRLVAPVISFTVACRVHLPMRDQESARLRVNERTCEPRQRLGPLRATAPVLQADRIAQSASSFSPAISDAVR